MWLATNCNLGPEQASAEKGTEKGKCKKTEMKKCKTENIFVEK